MQPDPRSLLPAILVNLALVRPPKNKKERRRWAYALNCFRVTVEVDGAGTIIDVTAYDLYLLSLLRWSPADPKQSPPPAL